ncbi:unnamed protein product [Tuber aestivum]|uniref:DUF1275 domain protein n=1 Tax=Tuber aestivum TaxID=59557 RepID=A0A292Q2Q9_9PEZI|nr:unnamed protein product [Tuber aestivum]
MASAPAGQGQSGYTSDNTTMNPHAKPDAMDEAPIEGSSGSGGVQSYLLTRISAQHADLPLLLCTFVSGIIDSSVYNAWTVFAAMQTGNTIFLSLGASNQPVSKPYGWLKSLIAISFFILGAILTYRLSTLNNPPPTTTAAAKGVRREKYSALSRGTLFTSFVLQGAAVFLAAGLVQGGAIPGSKPQAQKVDGRVDFWELLPLAFLAMQFGAQIATSRLLGIGEIPTTVLTSVYTDLVTDPLVLRGGNIKRNRRFGSILFMLLGGICGGWISKSPAGLAGSLFVGGAIKVGVAVGWLLFPGEAVKEKAKAEEV